MNCPTCQSPLEDPPPPFCRACGSQIPQVAEPADPMIGQVVGGKYDVIKRLGEGGMGCVYKGEQSLGTKKRNVAIKTLHAQFSHDPKVQARFERECGTMAGLEHPNTIQVYDFGKLPDGQLYIVMEFVKGESLADTLVKSGAMEPGRVENIMRQVCGSLEEAHAAGIVHRDLKPDNIVLCVRAGQQDFVKVLDFGIAKQSGEQDKQEQKLTQAGMVLGTPPYMSPEQFTGRPIDARSDIYSLGVMAYEMLAGKLPFEAETAFEWATKHMTVAPTPLEVTPNGLRAPEKMRAAVMRALAKRVEDRFSTVSEFFEAFGAGLAPPSAAISGQGAPSMAGGTAGMPRPQSGSAPQYSVPTGPVPVSGHAATQATGAVSAAGFAQPQRPMMPSGSGTALMQPGQQPPAQAWGTPVAGNVAFPTPPPMQAAPAASGGWGGGRIAALVLLILLVVGGGGGLAAYALRSKGDDSGSAAAATTTTPVNTARRPPAPTTSPGEQASPGLEPLNDQPDAATTAALARPTQTVAAPHPTVVPTTAPTPAPTPTHVYVPACGAAENARAAGRMNEFRRLAAQCRAAGGVVP